MGDYRDLHRMEWVWVREGMEDAARHHDGVVFAGRAIAREGSAESLVG